MKDEKILRPLLEEEKMLAAGYVLGDLTEEELEQVKELLAQNSEFLEEVRALTASLNLMPSALPKIDPPSSLESAILDAYSAQMEQEVPEKSPARSLSSAQSENLRERLGNPELREPPLAVPFALWSSLVANPSWRQQLSPRRQGISPPKPLANLSRWLENIFEAHWQAPESLNLAFSSRRRTTGQKSRIQRAKLIALGTEAEVILLVFLALEDDMRREIGIQMFPSSNRRYLPEKAQLTLLSDTGEILQSVQARHQDNTIRIPRFKCSVGFRFHVRLTLGENSVTEDFIV